MKTIYYVFGVGDNFEELGFDTLVKFLTEEPNAFGWDLFEFTKDIHPNELLDAFFGWRSYQEITEKQYLTLINVKIK